MNRFLSTGMLVRVMVGMATLAITTGCVGDDDSSTVSDAVSPVSTVAADGPNSLSGLVIDVRRDPGCGCCTSWVEYLQKHGATVDLSEDAERSGFRASLGITDEAASCHTGVVEGYAIEGHVPVSAIQRLLVDQPDAAGLALPGMPSESPGMGGDQDSWERLPVMLVANDGTLSPFDY